MPTSSEFRGLLWSRLKSHLSGWRVGILGIAGLLIAALAVLLKASPDTTNQTILIIGGLAVALLLVILWKSIVEIRQDEALARRKAEEGVGPQG